MKHSSARYILRIDDVCPTMKWDAFNHIAQVCNELAIAPIIGVVPDNQDKKLMVDEPKNDFWNIIKNHASSGWIIAQHGYQHIYNSSKTEFAGLSYDEQYKKIVQGKKILEQQLGFAPTWWMAPAHSFDATTCGVLRDTGFTHITDGATLYPYVSNGLVWVPQQLWKPRVMPFGTWTICLHPNTMSDQEVDMLCMFLRNHAEEFRNVSLEPKISVLNIPFRIIWNFIRALK